METQATHTPGPWKYARTHGLSYDRWYVITDADGWGTIFEAGGKDQNGQIAEAKYLITDPEIIEANARLIAAAPEMLEALQELAQIAREYVAEGIPRLDAAIEKAAFVALKARGELL